ncbi:hypothetical protein GGI07_003981 [Coemansia sp. Benny D115]|nr:hypothetical protein GGI07_003981 [Coemansia sp. Benny D115]
MITAIARLPPAALLASRPPCAMLCGLRRYTNTEVYSRGDGKSHREQLRQLGEEQKYLADLLKSDDSDAPWRRASVDTVSREVQQGLHEPEPWVPERALHH